MDKWFGRIFTAMRASPSYIPGTYQMILNVWTALTDGRINSTVMANAHPNGFEVAAYRDGNVGNDGTTIYFNTELAQTIETVSRSGEGMGVYYNGTTIRAMNNCGANSDQRCVIHIYEAGPGLTTPGMDSSCPTQAQLDAYGMGGYEGAMTSLAAQLYLETFGMRYNPHTFMEY